MACGLYGQSNPNTLPCQDEYVGFLFYFIVINYSKEQNMFSFSDLVTEFAAYFSINQF